MERNRRDRNGGVLDTVAELFDLPADLVAGLPHLEMVGTIVYASEGKLTPEDIPAILERGDRSAAGPTVPPGGLYLTKLWYDDGKVSFHVE